jgi:CDP-diacylglycerol--serine O-phosphatidyltransferase
MKKIQLLPNVITAFGLLCGLFVIFKLSLTPLNTVTPELLTQTAGILLLAALADLLDGAVARVMKAESEFGGLFDSMADAITFGVAPTIIVLKTLSLSPDNQLAFWVLAAALIFSISGVLRLVRYNVSSQLAKIDPALMLSNNKHFTGLPIPASAAALVSLNLFLTSQDRQALFDLSFESQAAILAIAMFLLGYFMVSRWKFPSLKTLHIRVASFRVVFLTVLAAVLILFGILHHFAAVFFAFSWSYLVIAWVIAIIRKIAGRKSKTLEEFEPDPEDEE